VRYKAISLAITILLIATPAIYAQENSYIVVETPQSTEPTTVITGQPFTQTYEVRFIDLIDYREEIIVVEEDLFAIKKIGDFDVLGFYIDKQIKQEIFLEHIWYLNFTFYIVNPKKGAYVVPPIEIPWKHKKAGQERDDPSILTNYEFKTEEVHVNYVTTIPEDDPYLEVRDGMNFGNFENRAWIWWTVAWSLRVLSIVLLLVVFVAWKQKQSSRKEHKAENKEVFDEIQVGEKIRIRSRFMAWFNLRMSIRRLAKCQVSGSRKAKEEVVSAMRDYLRVQIPQLSAGATPLSMMEYISENLKPFSAKRDSLLKLAQKTAKYQTDIERDKKPRPGNSLAEAWGLRMALGQSRPHRRAISFLRNSFSGAKNQFARMWPVTWLAEKLNKIRRQK